jgi:hypothetical protein
VWWAPSTYYYKAANTWLGAGCTMLGLEITSRKSVS